jgi:hypothetical protein
VTQVLHIFRKDVRCLRWELAVLGALTIAFTWSHVIADASELPELSRPVILEYLTSVLLAIGWGFLISQLVHEEALPGHRQFWITRPYSWKQLLGAKALFMVVCINAPLLVAQMVILAAAGFSPFGGFARLLWMQFAITVVLLVPAFALAAVTRKLAQVVFTALCAFMSPFLLLSRGRTVGLVMISPEWTVLAAALTILCAGAVLVVCWQYQRRRTRISILVGLCTIVAAGGLCLHLPITLPSILQSWMFRASEADAVSVSLRQPATATPERSPSAVVLGLPFAFANVPASEVAAPQFINIHIEGPSGVRWSSGWTWYNNLFAPAESAGYWHHIYFERDYYRRIAGGKVEGTLYFGVLKRTTLAVPPGHVMNIPGGGYCARSPIDKAHEVFCSSPFRRPYDTALSPDGFVDHPVGGIDDSGSEELVSRWQSPWPAEFALSPVFTDGFRCGVDTAVSFVREDPRAWVRRDFTTTFRLPPEPHQ